MSLEQLKTAILAVEENGCGWATWGDARHIAEIYEIELDAEDLAVLDRAIATEGHSLPADLRRIEREEWGQNFRRRRRELHDKQTVARCVLDRCGRVQIHLATRGR